MYCANFLRHLGRLITRCLIAHPEGADTIELAHWAYGEVLPRYARQNVRRHCLSFGIPRVGKRSRRFIWALPEARAAKSLRLRRRSSWQWWPASHRRHGA
jgi:hypothetical protein